MAKKKITRKELLKSPDEFLTFSERAMYYLRSHTRELKVAGIAFGVILVAVAAFQAYLRHVDKAGQDIYNTGYYLLAENLKPDGKPEAWKEASESFQKVLSDYGLADVAPLSLPQLGLLDFLNKDYDKAITFYRRFLEDLPDESYRPLAELAIAACYEAKGDAKKAIEVLGPLEADDTFKEAVLLSLARSYRIDNQNEKAKEVLKDFVAQYENSPYLPLAKAHLQE